MFLRKFDSFSLSSAFSKVSNFIFGRALSSVPLHGLTKRRDPDVPTHRGEFYPLNFNTLWDNPGN